LKGENFFFVKRKQNVKLEEETERRAKAREREEEEEAASSRLFMCLHSPGLLLADDLWANGAPTAWTRLCVCKSLFTLTSFGCSFAAFVSSSEL
jgi:hypothetical protein